MTVGVKAMIPARHRFISRVTAFGLAVVFIFSLTSCSSQAESEPFVNSTIAMGTVISTSLYSEDDDVSKSAVTDINKMINDLDRNKLSRNNDSSEIGKLNKEKKAAVSDITLDCIRTCLSVSEKCYGLFDITVGDLSSLWGIGTENARLPSKEEIDGVIKDIDYFRIMIDGSNVTIGDVQDLDLGAVGKGLACDEARKLLSKTEVTGGTVSVGGSVLVYGKNPNKEDGSFSVGIRDPFGAESDYIGVINTDECCISTSGDYEKVLEVDGKKYHHILNPKTGYPAESNVTSVTVVSESGILTDALSTACFILGYSQDSLELLEAFDAQAVFITKEKKVFYTSGLADKLNITDENFAVGEAK